MDIVFADSTAFVTMRELRLETFAVLCIILRQVGQRLLK